MLCVGMSGVLGMWKGGLDRTRRMDGGVVMKSVLVLVTLGG